MNAGSGKIGFRGFASRLRNQAKDVVGNYKLPTFDDMAKNDDYIHSPEFNVRGSSSSSNHNNNKNNNDKRSPRQQEGEIYAEHSIATTSVNGTADEASHYSTESSWSLLDRPSSSTGLGPGGKPTFSTTTTAPGSKRTEEQQQRQVRNDSRETAIEPSEGFVRPSTIPNSSSQQNPKKASVSLLSVVSDALQPTTQASAAARMNEYDKDNSGLDVFGRNKANTHSLENDDDSDQSSEEEFDEEDPIYSRMRNDNNNINSIRYGKDEGRKHEKPLGSDDAPASVITIKKSSNRFMDDVRLQTPLHQDYDADEIANIPSATDDIADNESTPTASNAAGPFGGLLKKMTVPNFNRMLFKRGPVTGQEAARQQRPKPPLARERPSRQESEQPEDAFETTTSDGMLGDEDLEELRQLQMAGKSSSAAFSIRMLTEYVREHRHGLFVAFTLVLSVYVFFKRARSTKSI